MNVPFSTAEFVEVLVQYNQTVWPAQPLLLGLAVAVLVLASGRSGGLRGRLAAAGLGLLWIWMAVAYHWAFFTRINPAAWGFGALFLLQGLLLVYEGAVAGRLTFAGAWAGRSRGLAALLWVYALLVYPLLGSLLGHGYPRLPTFGLPCPTTIFTFGLLLVAGQGARRRLWVIPLLWSVVGFGAALRFGIYEDVGLLLSGIAALAALLLRRRRRGAERRTETFGEPQQAGAAHHG